MANTSTVVDANQAATSPATGRVSVPVAPPPSARQPVLEVEVLLTELTARQHVRPHKPLRTVLNETRACPVAAERAMEWLGLDGAMVVGRVKRVELIQLARSLHRFWKRAVGPNATPRE